MANVVMKGAHAAIKACRASNGQWPGGQECAFFTRSKAWCWRFLIFNHAFDRLA